MSREKQLPSYRHYLVSVSLLTFFVCGLIALGKVYWISTEQPQTVVLAERPPDQSSLKDIRVSLQIRQVTKRYEPFPIWNPTILNEDSLVFRFNTGNAVSPEFSMLNVNNGVVTKYKADTSNVGRVIALPSGQKLLYSDEPAPNRTPKTYLYDFHSQRILKTFSGVVCALLPSGSAYVGMLGTDLFIQNIDNGQREKLVSVQTLLGKSLLTDVSRINPVIYYKLLQSFASDPSGSDMYIIADGQTDRGALYKVTLNRHAKGEVLAKGVFFSTAPLGNGNVLVAGKIGNQSGVFLYDAANGEFKNVVKGNILDLSATDDGKFAYINVGHNQDTELHIADLRNARVSFDRVLYSNVQTASLLNWSPNGKLLLCVSSQLDSSTVLRFSFQ